MTAMLTGMTSEKAAMPISWISGMRACSVA
jgi:hypothetical protein